VEPSPLPTIVPPLAETPRALESRNSGVRIESSCVAVVPVQKTACSLAFKSTEVPTISEPVDDAARASESPIGDRPMSSL